MYNLEDSMQSIIDQMQVDWDAQVAGLENDLAVLNQGLLDSISSYEGQLADMQAAWDLDAADYQGQLADMQDAWDADAADYQDQLSTLVDNHADAVAELNGQIDALQAEYDAYVILTDATIADMQENWDAEVESMQAAWNAQVAQLTQDAADAADAAALLLSNTILSYENSLDSLEFSYENEISGINSAHNAQLEEIAYLDSQEDAAYQATIDQLNNDKDGLNSDIDGLNSDIDGLNSDIDGLNNDLNALTDLQGETQASLDHYSSPITIDLQQGWNMIGFQWQNSQDVALSLAELGNSVHLIKNNSAAVYWPEFGFNSLGTVEPGQGYQLRMYYSYPGFQFPELGEGERLEVTPQVPEWVHEMVVPTHPNDVRSLVSVVNMLGQEVNPYDVFKGEVLLYLYSDGSVEKLIK
jgi:predicted  nucleic acid-binding Zn-ribbon protein